MLDSTTEQLLGIALGALVLWQAWLALTAALMIGSGRYGKVTVGIGPGLAALVVLIALVVLA